MEVWRKACRSLGPRLPTVSSAPSCPMFERQLKLKSTSLLNPEIGKSHPRAVWGSPSQLAQDSWSYTYPQPTVSHWRGRTTKKREQIKRKENLWPNKQDSAEERGGERAVQRACRIKKGDTRDEGVAVHEKQNKTTLTEDLKCLNIWTVISRWLTVVSEYFSCSYMLK